MPNYIFTTDDAKEFEVAMKGQSSLLALWELDNYLRNKCKWSPLSDETYKELDEVREQLRIIMDSNGLSLDLIE